MFVCFVIFGGGLKEKSHAEGLVERMLDGDWQRDEERDVAHPTADSRYRFERRIENERTWHAYEFLPSKVSSFFCLSLASDFGKPCRAVDKENKRALIKGIAYPLACDW